MTTQPKKKAPTRMESEVLQYQKEITFPTDENGSIETTAQWEVRRVLCLAMVSGFSWVYRNRVVLHRWRLHNADTYDVKGLSGVYPSNVMKTRTLANAVRKLEWFLLAEQEGRSLPQRMLLSGMIASCKKALVHYDLYQEEVVRHGISHTSNGERVVGFLGD